MAAIHTRCNSFNGSSRYPLKAHAAPFYRSSPKPVENLVEKIFEASLTSRSPRLFLTVPQKAAESQAIEIKDRMIPGRQSGPAVVQARKADIVFCKGWGGAFHNLRLLQLECGKESCASRSDLTGSVCFRSAICGRWLPGFRCGCIFMTWPRHEDPFAAVAHDPSPGRRAGPAVLISLKAIPSRTRTSATRAGHPGRSPSATTPRPIAHFGIR